MLILSVNDSRLFLLMACICLTVLLAFPIYSVSCSLFRRGTAADYQSAKPLPSEVFNLCHYFSASFFASSTDTGFPLRGMRKSNLERKP